MTKRIDADEIHVDVHNVTKYVTIDFGRGNAVELDDINGDGQHILVRDRTAGYRFTNNERCTIAPLDNIRAVNPKAAQEAQRGYLNGIQTAEGLY